MKSKKRVVFANRSSINTNGTNNLILNLVLSFLGGGRRAQNILLTCLLSLAALALFSVFSYDRRNGGLFFFAGSHVEPFMPYRNCDVFFLEVSGAKQRLDPVQVRTKGLIFLCFQSCVISKSDTILD